MLNCLTFHFMLSVVVVENRWTIVTMMHTTNRRTLITLTDQLRLLKIGKPLKMNTWNFVATVIRFNLKWYLIEWYVSRYFDGYSRSSLDYDDDRYYIANNLRNSHYALNPNPSPVQNPYVQKPIVVSNFPSNRLLSQMKRSSLTNSPTDPKQDVGLPRSSIVWLKRTSISV